MPRCELDHDDQYDDDDARYDDEDESGDVEHDNRVDDDHGQVEEEDCSGGEGGAGDAVGENCEESETVCDTVETEECYTKSV